MERRREKENALNKVQSIEEGALKSSLCVCVFETINKIKKSTAAQSGHPCLAQHVLNQRTAVVSQ